MLVRDSTAESIAAQYEVLVPMQDFRPIVIGADEPLPRIGKFRASLVGFAQLQHVIGHLGRLIGREKMHAVLGIKASRYRRRRHDRPPHRHRFESLIGQSPGNPQRRHDHPALLK